MREAEKLMKQAASAKSQGAIFSPGSKPPPARASEKMCPCERNRRGVRELGVDNGEALAVASKKATAKGKKRSSKSRSRNERSAKSRSRRERSSKSRNRTERSSKSRSRNERSAKSRSGRERSSKSR